MASTPAIFDNLAARLTRDDQQFIRFERYYRGDQPLAFASAKFRKAFGAQLHAFADNFCRLAVDAVEERLNVDGFRFGESPEADRDAWDIWQSCSLDMDSEIAHREALIYGRSYAMVWADANGAPRITVESARQTYVLHAAGNRRHRIAALKRWIEPDGVARSFLYLPDTITEYRSANPVLSPDPAGVIDIANPTLASAVDWVPGDTYDNVLGVVPVVPLTNRPSLLGHGESDLADLLPLQDSINKLAADMIVASEFTSYRQRWATGMEDSTPDLASGDVPVPPPDPNARLWVAGSPDTKFGTFEASDLSNYGNAIDTLIEHFAARSSLPFHYLAATKGQAPSGESLRAAEAALVSKVRRKQRVLGESWEEVMRLAFAVLGDPRADETRAETIWANPESRTDSERADALTKLQSLGVPDRQLQEDWGYTPETIERFRAMRREAALDGQGVDLTGIAP